MACDRPSTTSVSRQCRDKHQVRRASGRVARLFAMCCAHALSRMSLDRVSINSPSPSAQARPGGAVGVSSNPTIPWWRAFRAILKRLIAKATKEIEPRIVTARRLEPKTATTASELRVVARAGPLRSANDWLVFQPNGTSNSSLQQVQR
jgi:hypothetical protein